MQARRGAEGVKTVRREFIGRDIVPQLTAVRGVGEQLSDEIL